MEISDSLLLELRYRECDSLGHVSPDPRTKRCDHCFRRLEYRSNFLFPESAVNQDIAIQKELDRLYGLSKISELPTHPSRATRASA